MEGKISLMLISLLLMALWLLSEIPAPVIVDIGDNQFEVNGNIILLNSTSLWPFHLPYAVLSVTFIVSSGSFIS